MHNYKTAYSQSCNQSTEDLFKFWNNHLSQFVFIYFFFLSSGVWSVCCLPNSNEWLSGTVWWTQWQRPIAQLPGWFTFRWVCWSTLVPETAWGMQFLYFFQYYIVIKETVILLFFHLYMHDIILLKSCPTYNFPFFFFFFALLSCFRKRKIMKSSVRKQLWGAVEHSTSGRYHNLFDSDVFGENPLRVIFTRGNQQWKASHWGHTTYSSTDTP